MTAQVEKMFLEVNTKISELNEKVNKISEDVCLTEKKDYMFINELLQGQREMLFALQREVKAISQNIIKMQKDAKNCLESE